jgi:ribose transport system ATP-binding protein
VEDGQDHLTPDSHPLLRIESLSKRYPGTQALDEVSMTILPGEIHALAGQNGAGKSTLIRVLAGVEDADRGRVIYRGQRVHPRHAKLPFNFIHQDFGLVESMTVAENFGLVVGYPRRGGLIAWRALEVQTRDALRSIGSDVDPAQKVSTLATGQRALVAIARAVATTAEMVVLDEPTAALTAHEVDTLLNALHRLREQGVAMLYVTHRLDEVFRIADRVTVLRDGMVTLTGPVGAVTFAALVESIAGRSIDTFFPVLDPCDEKPVLEVEDATVGEYGPVSFALRRGEVLALVGLRGGGHDAIGRGLFGAETVSGGTVRKGGRIVPSGTVRGAMRHGIGFVSGRRAEEGLGGYLTVRENLLLNPKWVRARGFKWRRAERRVARELIARFGITPRNPERIVLTLSGGNQQKVVISRWIQAESDVLILEEPTAGVDVGAKTELYAAIAQLCRDGRACLLLSSDFDEVAGLAHRALVFDRGRIVSELSGDALTSEAISFTASGGAVATAAR